MKISIKQWAAGLIVCCATPLIQAAVSDNTWNYSAQKGPEHWGEHFSVCGKGQQQSPINIPETTPVAKQSITLHYQPALFNHLADSKDFSMKAVDPSANSVQFNGQTYYLQGFHFHTPSEHTLHNQRFPMEIHLVHQNKQGQLLVVGVLLTENAGKANATTREWSVLDANQYASGNTVRFNPDEVIPKENEYYLYSGSLTTPPCSENVQWVVYKQPLSLTAEQVSYLKKNMIPFNSRPVQPLHERRVTVHS